jgi:uncharacterized protein YprB with RNaseH-like and TPR domain
MFSKETKAIDQERELITVYGVYQVNEATFNVLLRDS